jgi:hypothetical protein
MKKLILLIVLVLTTASVFAEVIENNYFYEGLITKDGRFEITNNPVGEVNLIGFLCGNAECSSVSGRFFEGVRTSQENYLEIRYPTNLISEHGYGIFAYKEGYLPLEIYSDWRGEGTVTENDQENIIRPMYKIESCESKIVSLDNEYNGRYLDAIVVVKAPIEHHGILNYQPLELQSHYSTPVRVNIEITENNRIVYENSQRVNLAFSDREEIVFRVDLDDGNYRIRVFTTLEDAQVCRSYNTNEIIRFINIERGNQRDDDGRRQFPVYPNIEGQRDHGVVFTSDLDTNETDFNGSNNESETPRETIGNGSTSYWTTFIILLLVVNIILLVILYFSKR